MDLKIFNNEKFGEVRTLNIEGKIYFVGKDVAEILGYENQNRDIKTHVDEEDRIMMDRTQYQNGIEFDYKILGQRGGWIINESGLYSLILSSKQPNAKEFKRWVTSEVLPTIRQTGGYIPLTKEDTDEEIMAKALLIAQKTIEKKDKLIEDLTPKANWFDSFINSEGTYTATQVAKVLHMTSAKALNKVLNEKGLIYKQGKGWIPYSKINDEWYKLIVGSTKEGHAYSTLKWTPRGVYEISKLLEIDITEEDLVNI